MLQLAWSGGLSGGWEEPVSPLSALAANVMYLPLDNYSNGVDVLIWMSLMPSEVFPAYSGFLYAAPGLQCPQHCKHLVLAQH